MRDFRVKWGICEEKARDFCLNAVFAKRKRVIFAYMGICKKKMRDFWVKWGILEEKTRDFR